MANAEVTPAEAGRRGESAIELIAQAQEQLETLDGYIAGEICHGLIMGILGKLSEAQELLVDDGR